MSLCDNNINLTKHVDGVFIKLEVAKINMVSTNACKKHNELMICVKKDVCVFGIWNKKIFHIIKLIEIPNLVTYLMTSFV